MINELQLDSSQRNASSTLSPGTRQTTMAPNPTKDRLQGHHSHV